MSNINIQYPSIFEPFATKKKRYKIAHGGRGGAKTETIARLLIGKALKISGVILCLREIQKSIDSSVYSTIKRLIIDSGLSGLFEIQAKKIISRKTGCIFLFHGLRDLTVDNLKSIDNVKICWVEEAHAVTKNSWDILRPSIRGEDSEIWVSFNRRRVDDPVWEELCDQPTPDTELLYVTYKDNEFFPDVLEKERLRDLKRNELVYKHIWLGEPLNIEGLCYPEFSRERHLIDKERVGIFNRAADSVYNGLDWGFSHPMGIVRILRVGERYIVTKEYKHTEKVINSDWIFNEFAPMGDGSQRVICDNARPELIAYCNTGYMGDTEKRHGFRFVPCAKYAGSVLDEIDTINRLLRQDRLLIGEDLKQLIREFETWSWKENAKKEIPEEIGEDLLRAAGYCIMYLEKNAHNVLNVL